MKKVVLIVIIGFIFINTLGAIEKSPIKLVKDISKKKDGFFVGIEGDLGSASAIFKTESKKTDPLLGIDISPYETKNISSATIDAGLVGGYQHYFKNYPNMGIKVSGHLYLGYSGWKDDGKDLGSVFKDFGPKTYKLDLSAVSSLYYYIPIKVGFDVKYLWDFFEQGNHILGLNVGIGYQMDFYSIGSVKALAKKVGEQKPGNFPYLFSDNFYPILGLHYYYKNHHQFELMFRFGGIGKKDAEGTSYEENSVYIYKRTTQITNKRSYLTFNYAYRF